MAGGIGIEKATSLLHKLSILIIRPFLSPLLAGNLGHHTIPYRASGLSYSCVESVLVVVLSEALCADTILQSTRCLQRRRLRGRDQHW